MQKNKLIHCPLEGYRQRYTELLADWELEAFSKSFDVKQIVPVSDTLTSVIRNGSVLDSTNRPIWAMRQVEEILTHHNAPPYSSIYLSDFFHPGVESLAYAGYRGTMHAYCWAQSFDQYDFTTKFGSWFRAWEYMALDLYSTIFVAHPLLRDLIATTLPSVADKICVVGLPFNSQKVGATADLSNIESFHCVYSSRWDKEKCPHFFLDVVDRLRDYSFLVCTGWDDLKGTDGDAIRRALSLEAQGRLTIRRSLTKPEYYGLLSGAKVQFNCAMQDWVSFTLLEALTFGCQPLYPNHRSFPDTLCYSTPNLYVPLNIDDACSKLVNLIESDIDFPYRRHILNHHDGTLSRIASLIA